ncbi:MAG: hypothetical protein HYS04_12165 [Acidobacteria bacterium]|nr:hypothetical protein [Acidobacteriota bacterium]
MRSLLGFAFVIGAAVAAELTVGARSGVTGDLNPAGAVWQAVEASKLALHRTPPQYATEPPSALEIASVEVKVIRGAGKTWVRLAWPDPSAETASLDKPKKMWQSEGLVRQSAATNRFFDGCAVMLPAQPVANDLFPSLQMGDALHPVLIYYYDAARGAEVMEAAGRGTTKRTGRKFPARATWAGGNWTIVLELPEVAAGTPLSVAVWNGGQQDRDGRKYFSVWHRLQ